MGRRPLTREGELRPRFGTEQLPADGDGDEKMEKQKPFKKWVLEYFEKHMQKKQLKETSGSDGKVGCSDPSFEDCGEGVCCGGDLSCCSDSLDNPTCCFSNPKKFENNYLKKAVQERPETETLYI